MMLVVPVEGKLRFSNLADICLAHQALLIQLDVERKALILESERSASEHARNFDTITSIENKIHFVLLSIESLKNERTYVATCERDT